MKTNLALIIVVKLSNADFRATKFSDVYPSLHKVVGRFGKIHLDSLKMAPHNAEFNLYAPYFETLSFQLMKDDIWIFDRCASP